MAKIKKFNDFEEESRKAVNENITVSQPNREIIDYAEKYGIDALGYAIYNMAKNGEIEFSMDNVNNVWEYDGNTGEY